MNAGQYSGGFPRPSGREQPLRVAFVYSNPRARLAAEVAAGRVPDTVLLGANHLAAHGIEAAVHDPVLGRNTLRRGPAARIAWYARELTLPWELRRYDAVCSALGSLYPLLDRRRRVLVFNLGLVGILARSPAPRRRVLVRSLRRAAGVLCFAAAQRERLLELAPLDAERVHVILNGADERFFAPAPTPADGYVLAVGRDVARDYRTLARALHGLEARAILVASPRNLDGVTLPSSVEVRLDLSFAELRELYAGAACVVVPTRREDFTYGADCSGQTVVLDALACARPVIVSARATLREYVRPGETALTVPPEEPDALRDALERILGDGELAARLGQAGREDVERRLTTARIGEQLAPLLFAAATNR